MPGAKPSDGTGAGTGSIAGGAAASTGRSGTIGALASAPHGQCCCTAPASWLPAFSSGIVIVPPGLAGSEQMRTVRSEEHTSELQSLMRISYAVFCLKKKKIMRLYHHTL